MKKCFLIVDYSDTEEKKNILLNLIKDIKSHEYDVFLSSHINHDTDITKYVDYLYYDKNNNLNYEYKYKYPKVFVNDSFKIKYKPLNKFSTHGFAIMSITLPPLSLLKSMGYEIVHKIEYDNFIKDWGIIENFEKKLLTNQIVGSKRCFNDNKTCVLSGELKSMNLKTINYENLEYDYLEYKKCFDMCLVKYNSVIFEYVIHENFTSKLKYFMYDENYLDQYLNRNLIRSVIDYFDIKNNFCFFEINDTIKLFIDNLNGDKNEFMKLIFDEKDVIEITINNGEWKMIPINKSFDFVEIEISGEKCGKLNRNSDYIKKTIFKYHN